MTSTATKPHVLLENLAMVESPRWHRGRLWFPRWGTEEIIAVDLESPRWSPASRLADTPLAGSRMAAWPRDRRSTHALRIRTEPP